MFGLGDYMKILPGYPHITANANPHKAFNAISKPQAAEIYEIYEIYEIKEMLLKCMKFRKFIKFMKFMSGKNHCIHKAHLNQRALDFKMAADWSYSHRSLNPCVCSSGFDKSTNKCARIVFHAICHATCTQSSAATLGPQG